LSRQPGWLKLAAGRLGERPAAFFHRWVMRSIMICIAMALAVAVAVMLIPPGHALAAPGQASPAYSEMVTVTLAYDASYIAAYEVFTQTWEDWWYGVPAPSNRFIFSAVSPYTVTGCVDYHVSGNTTASGSSPGEVSLLWGPGAFTDPSSSMSYSCTANGFPFSGVGSTSVVVQQLCYGETSIDCDYNCDVRFNYANPYRNSLYVGVDITVMPVLGYHSGDFEAYWNTCEEVITDTCGTIIDPDLELYDLTWTPDGGATWDPVGGVWTIPANGSIEQTDAFTTTGEYSVTIVANVVSGGSGNSQLDVTIGSETHSLVMAGSDDLTYELYMFTVTAGPHTVRLSVPSGESSVRVTHICTHGPFPQSEIFSDCNVTEADLATDALMQWNTIIPNINNGLDFGETLQTQPGVCSVSALSSALAAICEIAGPYAPGCKATAGTAAAVARYLCSTNKQFWKPEQWGSNTIPVKGPNFDETAFGSSVELMSIVGEDDSTLTAPFWIQEGQFTVILKVKRLHPDTTLRITSLLQDAYIDPDYSIKEISTTAPYNEWKSFAIWFDFPLSCVDTPEIPICNDTRYPGMIYFGLQLQAMCSGMGCNDTIPFWGVDEIYVIPKRITCGFEPRELDCINGNGHMAGPDYEDAMRSPTPEYVTNGNQGWHDFVWNWFAHMGDIGFVSGAVFPDVARLYPDTSPRSYVRQYVKAGYGNLPSDWDGLAINHNYKIFGSVFDYEEPPGFDANLLISIGPPGYQWSATVNLNSFQPQFPFIYTFTASEDMLAGQCAPGATNCNIALIAENANGNGTRSSILLDILCIQEISGTIALTPTMECLGNWVHSGAEPGPPWDMDPGEELQNSLDLSAQTNYAVIITGTSDVETNEIVLYYINTTTSVTRALGISQDIAYGDFAILMRFATSSALYGGQVRLQPADEMTIDAVCLGVDSSIPTIPTPPRPPIILPLPECGSINEGIPSTWTTSTISFYLRPPYTEVVSSTVYITDTSWATWAGMWSYNAAVYHMACTTVSIANWNFKAFNALMSRLTSWYTSLMSKLQEILEAILALGGGGGGGGTAPGLLDLILKLIDLFVRIIGLLLRAIELVLRLAGMVLQILIAIIAKGFQLLGVLISMLQNLSAMYANPSATAYEISCADDAQAICFGLAALTALDEQAGSWLSIVTAMVITVTGFYLIQYIVSTVREILQPGAGESP
jgi:hypothetical protein